MRRIIGRQLLRHFGLDSMPEYSSAVTKAFKDDIIFALENRQMLVLSGEIGAGKSMLFRHVEAEMKQDVTFVYVRNFYKEHVTIANILNAIIYSLSGESEAPRRDLEARSTQAVRLLGMHHSQNNKEICLVIEEAHRLHANTLRALKELREAEFCGRSPLFSVALIGHPGLLEKMKSRREAYWRSHTIQLDESHGWMRLEERERYLKFVFGEAVTKGARTRIASLVNTPLALDFYVEEKMVEARRAGKDVIDDSVVQPTGREMKDAYNLSVSQIAKACNLPTSTVQDAITNDDHRQSPLVKATMERLAVRAAKAS